MNNLGTRPVCVRPGYLESALVGFDLPQNVSRVLVQGSGDRDTGINHSQAEQERTVKSFGVLLCLVRSQTSAHSTIGGKTECALCGLKPQPETLALTNSSEQQHGKCCAIVMERNV